MLIVDDREHGMSTELGKHDIEHTVMRLEYGDYSFEGNGEFGSCMVGCERKKLSDLINSMKDRRLSGAQLRGMAESYDYLFLFVEDVFRPGPHGEIEWLRGREWVPFYGSRDRTAVMYRHLDSYLNSLSLRFRSRSIGEPLRVKRAQNARETAAQLVSLYKGFTEKDWADHHAHDQIYAPGPDTGARGGRVGVAQERVTYAWSVAIQMPALDRRAKAAADHFGTPQRMANATVQEWMGVREEGVTKAGRKKPGIGKETAEAIVRAMQVEGECRRG